MARSDHIKLLLYKHKGAFRLSTTVIIFGSSEWSLYASWTVKWKTLGIQSRQKPKMFRRFKITFTVWNKKPRRSNILLSTFTLMQADFFIHVVHVCFVCNRMHLMKKNAFSNLSVQIVQQFCRCSQIYANDHLWTANTCLKWPPFWGPI
jgi:hypothetical protein